MVHFVGAGPGAADLITLRGAGLLEEADLVIYAGSLVDPAILGHCSKKAALYDSAELSLSEVTAIIREAEEKSGGSVSIVRLHSGDPSLYGAIREQIDELKRLGITFDITPGVSSFNAAAAALESEYTV
ncbi:MAG: cobalt-precorrin-4/precorrin-4 C(11)-methyltransferase, partial [Lachnospiraceae bacterium]|nr:cobalt-precorrin-4/precorrin-4 C(11)-methyltransferase [Lachnospiraceae bacterium]